MSEIVKSQWATDENHVHLSMPIAKVDQENRLVSGFATLDNVDSQGDIVTAEASAKAFARARGNIREMHQPIAVGKMMDFREDEFYYDGKFYRGIYVTVYVSKGAEATWEKVLDGTLTGFSIGGNILEQDNEYVADLGKSVRFIKDYELIELSLVDNPANQLANVFSVTKASNGSVTVKGMAVETEIENVFWCKNDQRVQAVAADSANCITCGDGMDNIGWFEQGGDRAEKVRNVVTKFLGLNAEENAEGEGGVVEVSDTVTKSETPAEETPTEGTPETENVAVDSEPAVPNVTPAPEDRPADESVAVVNEEANTAALQAEETVDPDEVPDEQEEIAKRIDALHDAVKESLEATRTETTEKVAALEKQIADVAESFTQKASELENKFSEFGDKLEAAKGRLAEFEKALEVVNSSEAVKKSGDVESPEPVQKSASVWNGAFSVNNLLG